MLGSGCFGCIFLLIGDKPQITFFGEFHVLVCNRRIAVVAGQPVNGAQRGVVVGDGQRGIGNIVRRFARNDRNAARPQILHVAPIELADLRTVEVVFRHVVSANGEGVGNLAFQRQIELLLLGKIGFLLAGQEIDQQHTGSDQNDADRDPAPVENVGADIRIPTWCVGFQWHRHRGRDTYNRRIDPNCSVHIDRRRGAVHSLDAFVIKELRKPVHEILECDHQPHADDQQQNSIMAIGSGQLLGKGLGNDAFDSVKNGNYISEPHTDFIFAVAGEELGFLGSVLIIALIFFITIEILLIAKRAKDISGKLICVGMATLIGFQSFVNICVVTGLLPNTGLPLPFVSYGLTSLVTVYFGVGIVLNVGLQAKNINGRLF